MVGGRYEAGLEDDFSARRSMKTAVSPSPENGLKKSLGLIVWSLSWVCARLKSVGPETDRRNLSFHDS